MVVGEVTQCMRVLTCKDYDAPILTTVGGTESANGKMRKAAAVDMERSVSEKSSDSLRDTNTKHCLTITDAVKYSTLQSPQDSQMPAQGLRWLIFADTLAGKSACVAPVARRGPRKP